MFYFFYFILFYVLGESFEADKNRPIFLAELASNTVAIGTAIALGTATGPV